MAQRPRVPKFGNWESEDDVPYTIYFDKARKGRTGTKMINPNDPQENPDMFPNMASPAQSPPHKTRTEADGPIARGTLRPTHERRVSREDGDLKHFTESPAHNENVRRRASNESTHQRQGGRGAASGRPVRQSAGSDHSIDRSPLHPQHQAKIAGKGSGSPAWEGRNSYENNHGTPGRSRLKPRGDETPDRSAAVPKFGDWDENNPSAENYTHIFNEVSKQKKNGSPMVSGRDTESAYNRRQSPNTRESAKICCFPWGGK